MSVGNVLENAQYDKTIINIIYTAFTWNFPIIKKIVRKL